jgi:hypothetical protein
VEDSGVITKVAFLPHTTPGLPIHHQRILLKKALSIKKFPEDGRGKLRIAEFESPAFRLGQIHYSTKGAKNKAGDLILTKT